MHTRLYIFIVFVFRCISCSGQIDSFYVKPIVTSSLFNPALDSHFVAHNPSVTSKHKLLVVMGGTGSSPRRLKLFPTVAANEGYDVIGLAYPNAVAAVSCDMSTDTTCFDNFRHEVVFGTPLSTDVTVDTTNSIYNRLIMLLKYLAVNYPSDHWSEYISGDILIWNKIIVSGHSQGAGHAAYLGKVFSVSRVLMFSGPNDYSDYYSNSAHWIREPGVTSLNNHYVFLHLQDDAAGFGEQYSVINGLGLLSGDDTTIVDNSTTPYSNSHCLYTNATPQLPIVSGSYHGSTMTDARTPLDGSGYPLHAPVWKYMLNAALVNVDDIAVNSDLWAYPNPATNTITCTYKGNCYNTSVSIFNYLGQIVNCRISGNNIDISNLTNGVYFMRVNVDRAILHFKFVKN